MGEDLSTTVPDRDQAARSEFARAVDRMTRQTLDGSETLEQSAKDILATADRVLHYMSGGGRGRSRRPCRQEIIEGLAHRYGLLGGPPVPLETIGKIIGLTRERARQIQVRHESMSDIQQLWWPQLDAALNVARTMAPCAEDALADELARRRITVSEYCLESLRACAAFAGRPFELESVDGTVATDSSDVSAVLRAARKLSSRQGLASLLQISDEILDEGVVLNEDDIGALLSVSRSVVRLDAGHVTWTALARNRLVNTLRTMLSVHQPVELAATQKAISNFWSYRNTGRTAAQPDLTPPTAEALRAFCEWHDHSR